MKLKLKNNSNLTLSNISEDSKISMKSINIESCPEVESWGISKSILSKTGNTLERVRIEIGNTIHDTFSNLSLFFKSGLGGFDANNNPTMKPAIVGTLTIDSWILESNRIETLGKIGNEFTLTSPNVAYDVEENQTSSLHFHELTPPTIESSTFDFSDYSKIYVGRGESSFEDERILALYKNSWTDLVDKLDTWYNYLNERDIDTTTYDIVPWIMSDRVDYIDTQISDATYIMVDAAYILKPTNNIVVMGNEDTGFKGNSGGIGFGSTEFISGDTYQTDSTERLYEADLTPGNHRYFLDKVEIPETPGETISEIGNVTLFGNSSSKVMAKLYGCTLKSGNTILANYVPVRRKSDNYPGLYDKINNVFKFNSKYYCDGATRYLTTEDNLHITTEDGEEILI